MASPHTLEERLSAVERAVTDEDVPVASVDDAAALTSRLDAVESRLETLEARIDETDAAVAAVRGYVGEIRHVNEEVERTANAAVAAVDRLDAASGGPPPIATAQTAESRVPASAPDGKTSTESGERTSTGVDDVTSTDMDDGTSTDETDRSLLDRLGSLL